jgi:hypothetical protein
MLGVRGFHPTTPGENARQLARIIGGAVLRETVSLCSSGSRSPCASARGARSVCPGICCPLSECIAIWRESDRVRPQ